MLESILASQTEQGLSTFGNVSIVSFFLTGFDDFSGVSASGVGARGCSGVPFVDELTGDSVSVLGSLGDILKMFDDL